MLFVVKYIKKYIKPNMSNVLEYKYKGIVKIEFKGPVCVENALNELLQIEFMTELW